MRIVIASYGRADKVTTTDLFPEAVIVCPETQVEEYKKFNREVISIPDELDGSISKKRNACLNLFPDEDIFLCDDDIVSLIDLTTKEAVSSERAEYLVENGLSMSKELGAGYFGFALSNDPLKITDYHPFSLTKQFYTGVGIISDRIRYDERLELGEDVDFYLQKLNKYRKVLRFNLYYFKVRSAKAGGIADRTGSFDVLIKKWGSEIVRYKDREKGVLGIRVPIKGI